MIQIGRFLIAGKLNQVRTEEIDGYLEDDEIKYNTKKSPIYIHKCEMCEDIGESPDILAEHKKKRYFFVQNIVIKS